MIRARTLQAREKLLRKLPVSGELLRGTLLERTVRHSKNCAKCARGEGHQVFVLTVTYPGGRTRQISVRRSVPLSRRYSLARLAGALWRPDQDPYAVFPVGQERCMEENVRDVGGRCG